ncbi:MAG: glycine cleavage system protein GcvH [Clostridia bacterium]
MKTVAGLKYSREHEWVKVEGSTAYVGVTNYAQLQLGDIVYVEMPEVGVELARGDVICAIESVKTAADVYSPLSGKILQANTELDTSPEKVNEEPYEAWILRMELSDVSELDDLMDESEYASFVESEG